MNAASDEALAAMYARVELLDPASIFAWPADADGMGGSLDRYVERRLPTAQLRALDGRLERIVIASVHPAHAPVVFPAGTLLARTDKTDRPSNRVRPAFLLAADGRQVLVAVPPGLDYLKHYASLIGHVSSRFRRPPELQVRFHPDAAASIASWTGLSSLRLKPDTVVVVGHADEYGRRSRMREGSIESLLRNDHLDARMLRTRAGRAVVLLGFDFSFWGDIAGRIAASLYVSGACEVIYLGKVGALAREIELYRDLVIPRRFMLAEHDRVIVPPFGVRNGLTNFADTDGLHVSTPTILEQSHMQREALESAGPRTIDNEISHMALAAARHGHDVAFSSLSFATDYVRASHQDDLPVSFELADNRTPAARHLRRTAIDRAASLLDRYLGA